MLSMTCFRDGPKILSQWGPEYKQQKKKKKKKILNMHPYNIDKL